MILIFLKNLQNQNNPSEKKKILKLLKPQPSFLMEGKKFLMHLQKEYSPKENRQKEKMSKYFSLNK